MPNIGRASQNLGREIQQSRILLGDKPDFQRIDIPSQDLRRISLRFPMDTHHVVSGRSKMHILGSETAITRRGLSGLSGQNRKLTRAVRATGRIGFVQRGVPTSRDKSMGTGFLITPHHVMTNRHVFKSAEIFFKTNKKRDVKGIEFGAEKGSSRSYFRPFSGEYAFLGHHDLVILELANPVLDRLPITFDFSKAKSFENVKIAVVGYPHPRSRDYTLLSVVEKNPLWGIKRISTGEIFRHSTDKDDEFGIEVESFHSNPKLINAICHSASTAPGGSGSPLIRRDNGKVCAVHFMYESVYRNGESANLAMPAISFRKALRTIGINL